MMRILVAGDGFDWRFSIDIDNRLQMNLSQLNLRHEATIRTVDWRALGERESRRLRELGFDEGVAIEPLHVGGWWARDPIAVRMGRMTIAIRRAVAERIEVDPVNAT